MNENDLTRLRHMRDAANEVEEFARGKSRQILDTDRQLVRALSMSVGIIGEAASRISAEIRAANPQLPWPQIIGMRNRLIHAYFEVDLDRLWQTVTKDIPPLIAELEKIILANESGDVPPE